MKIRRVVSASFSRAQYAFPFQSGVLVNHHFIRFIRVIRGSIVFRCEGGDVFLRRAAATGTKVEPRSRRLQGGSSGRLAVVSHWPLDYWERMTAAAALDKQIERYRQMTGEERLAVALELHELSCEIAREGIRRTHPGADAVEVEQLLQRRLKFACAE